MLGIRKFKSGPPEPGMYSDRIEIAVCHLLRIAEAILYFGSLTTLSADWSAKWLFRA